MLALDETSPMLAPVQMQAINRRTAVDSVPVTRVGGGRRRGAGREGIPFAYCKYRIVSGRLTVHYPRQGLFEFDVQMLYLIEL
ncbi:hypothetical protein EVAR_68893_1 [Eumeta japonica]|uniref:Uncharacterized protein n=1 Tax=Eumeta variegata TaxID=151549 RepID=A0A4C1ZV24_EUMVA|nr:hypothetical protein EVAR_68893_1 [Eumeta japonica]